MAMAMMQASRSSILLSSPPSTPPLSHRLLRRFKLWQCSSGSSAQGTSTASQRTRLVGKERLQEGAVPGSYWGDTSALGEVLVIRFNKGVDDVCVSARAGENLLRVAERCGLMVPNHDFCFEGVCTQCEMEVVGGAHEVGYHGERNETTIVRSCICPVPQRSNLEVRLVSEEDLWSERVV